MSSWHHPEISEIPFQSGGFRPRFSRVYQHVENFGIFLHFLKIKFSTCEIGLGWCIRTETSNFLKFFCEDNFEQNCTFFVPGKSANFRGYYLRETHAIAPKNAVAFSEGILGKIWTFLGDVHTEKITTFCKKFFTLFFQNPWNKIVSLRKFSVLFKFL